MALPEKLSAVRERAERQIDVLNSKEKTTQALLLPFFDAMGYDPFDVREVEPGRAPEVGGEGPIRIDYTVKIDGAPALLFQCTEAGDGLDDAGTRLFRYLGELEASLAAVTNGVRYQFYADLGEGIADRRPFFEFDLLDFEPGEATYLQRLTKQAFETDEPLAAAFDLKYSRLLRNYLVQQRENPDRHFVRFLAAQVHEGDVSEATVKRFRAVVQELLQQIDMERSEKQSRDHGQLENTGLPGPDGTPDTTSQPNADLQPDMDTQPQGQESRSENEGGVEPPEQNDMAVPQDGDSERQREDRDETAPSSIATNGEEKSAGAEDHASEDTSSAELTTDEQEGLVHEEASGSTEEREEGDGESAGESGAGVNDESDGGSGLANKFAEKVIGDSQEQ